VIAPEPLERCVRNLLDVLRPAVEPAPAELGLAYLPEDQVASHLAHVTLIRVLDDWCSPFPGYHLYYPSRRQSGAAFTLLVEALRYRG